MVILYNPENGKAIGRGYNDFNINGTLIDAHKPGELKQYSDSDAKILVDIFTFLEEVTPDQAKKILEKPVEKKNKCEYCDFSTDHHLALKSHMKKHAKEIAAKKEPVIDPNLVPVSGGEKIADIVTKPKTNDDETRDGFDKDGVNWYGGGVKEERGSMNPTTPFNQGHFGGQQLTDDE